MACMLRCFLATTFSFDHECAVSVQSQPPKCLDGAFYSLDAAVEAMNIAKDALSVTPGKAVVGSIGFILTMIEVGFLPLSSALTDRGPI